MNEKGQRDSTEERKAAQRAKWQRWYNSLSDEAKAAHRAKRRANTNRYRTRNRETVRERERAYVEANRERVILNRRKSKLMRAYGLTLEAYQALQDKQDGKCAICGKDDISHVDHDHATGLVRGLLCRECNIGLGHFHDSASTLVNAARYLEQHNAVA